MWGITTRGARLADGQRPGRIYDSGLVRATVRGPVEHAILDVDGELDFTSADGLVDAVAALPHTIVAVDVSALEFVDGAGVRAVRQIVDDVRERTGRAPAITGMTRAVQRAFDIVSSRTPVGV